MTVGRAWILKRPQTRMNTTFLLSFLIRASVHVSVVNQITFNFLLDFSVPVAYNQGTRPISCWFSVRPARLHPDGAFAISRTPATAGQRRWGRAPAGYRSACSSGRSPPAASLLGPCSAKARTWCHLRKMFYALSSLWSKAVCPFGLTVTVISTPYCSLTIRATVSKKSFPFR